MAKFKDKYRIESNRMPSWNYAGNGRYFITLVTQNRDRSLGTIVNNKMILSDFGKIIQTEWKRSFELRKELFLDEYIIMPNHLHAIITLKKNKMGLDGDMRVDTNVNARIEIHGRASQQSINQPKNLPINCIRKPRSISSFIGGYKSAINTKIDDNIDDNNLNIPKYNRNNHFFQPNYHDRIIRDNIEYWRIKNYIKNNPKNWDDDNFNNKQQYQANKTQI